jgi:hypothetical protein
MAGTNVSCYLQQKCDVQVEIHVGKIWHEYFSKEFCIMNY